MCNIRNVNDMFPDFALDYYKSTVTGPFQIKLDQFLIPFCHKSMKSSDTHQNGYFTY